MTTSFPPLIKSSFSTTTYRFLQLKQKIKGSPDSNQTNKSIRSCYVALHRITAPQFIRICLYSSWYRQIEISVSYKWEVGLALYSSWYKQIPNRCLLLIAIKTWDLLIRLKTISMLPTVKRLWVVVVAKRFLDQAIKASTPLLAHNRITASQFIRRNLHFSWYK